MTTPLGRAELRTWIRMIWGIKALLNELDRQLRDQAGMSHDDYQILSQLHRAPKRTLRMTALARGVGFSTSRLSHAVSRMEEAGWIDRRPSTIDRRGTDASLTDLGLRVVEDASMGHLELVRRAVFETLGPERAGATADALDEIGRSAREEG
ncbi:MAG TPA: MarR family transcriptional regulator [Acidimicrobiia bacterium]|nr:MarR family transcriptional regulator [Acidimicrobiia bacterium]